MLDILLKEGSLILPAIQKAYMETAQYPENEERHYNQTLLDVYSLLKSYVDGGHNVSGGTGLAFSLEAFNLQNTILGVGDVWRDSRNLVKEIPAHELASTTVQRADGRVMRATLLNEQGHSSSDEGGVIAELIEVKGDVIVGSSEFVYLGHDWFTAEQGGSASFKHMYKAANLGRYTVRLESPAGYISARSEDYPDMATFYPPSNPLDAQEVDKSIPFMDTVCIFASLVEANEDKLGLIKDVKRTLRSL